MYHIERTSNIIERPNKADQVGKKFIHLQKNLQDLFLYLIMHVFQPIFHYSSNFEKLTIFLRSKYAIKLKSISLLQTLYVYSSYTLNNKYSTSKSNQNFS